MAFVQPTSVQHTQHPDMCTAVAKQLQNPIKCNGFTVQSYMDNSKVRFEDIPFRTFFCQLRQLLLLRLLLLRQLQLLSASYSEDVE